MSRLRIGWKACATIVLAGLAAAPAQAGHWEVSVSSTNTSNKSASAGGQANAASASAKTSAVVSATVAGPTGAVFAEAQAGYSGTWQFKWIPDGPNDWPSNYTVTGHRLRTYTCKVIHGTGTASVSATGGATLASASLPNAGVNDRNAPEPVTVTDTSDPNLTVKTITNTLRVTRGEAGKMSDVRVESVTTQRAYLAAWFSANFATPADIILTFPVAAVDVTARVDHQSTVSQLAAVALASVSDTFVGQ